MFLPFIDTFHNLTEPSAAGARRGVRSVPVIHVPSRRFHWALPAEGRPGPSDNDDNYDHDNHDNDDNDNDDNAN